jgi:ABC-type lipoprotein export system ATPase subunit/GNAT superfamily N-acetyltransferase
MAATDPPAWRFRVDVRLLWRVGDDPPAARVAGMFGLAGRSETTLYDGLEVSIAPGKILAITGPSGSGKSVLLDALRRQAGRDAICLRETAFRTRRVAVSVLSGGSLAARLEVLSRCGLAEAAALVTPARHLSGGQQARLALAAALHRARRRRRPTLILADEFAAALDAITGAMLCRQVRRLVSRSPVALAVATPRPELLDHLRPDTVISKPLGEPARQHALAAGEVRLAERPGGSGCACEAGPAPIHSQTYEPPETWPIRRGSLMDYDALAPFHYLAGRPAAHKRVYAIDAPWGHPAAGGPRIAAVLVVSPPLANVRGRNLATDGRYGGSDRAAALRLANAEIECISRVIVHPVFRGQGLAVRLVEHAIATAETPLVEALAAMGALHPLFARAGMDAWRLPPDRHVARLLSAAEACGLCEPQLAAVEPVRRLLESPGPHRDFLQHEIRLAARRLLLAAERTRERDWLPLLCGRACRRYVYYLAATRKETSCPAADLPPSNSAACRSTGFAPARTGGSRPGSSRASSAPCAAT